MPNRRLWVTAIFILAPGVLLAPVWLSGGLGAGEDDVLYYFPSRLYFQQTINDGHWPWLNPLTGLGRPFAADPQSALWYPPTWLFAVMRPQSAYPLSLWLHYALAAWGMYRLLRCSKLSRRAAVFGGIVFAFSGFMVAHRAHFAMQNAAAWIPWVFWRLRRFDEAGGAGRLTSAAAAATLQCLAGHIQIAAMTALGSLVYLLFLESRRRVALRRWLAIWCAAGGLYAIQWLPTFAYVLQCTRVDNDYWDFTQNSWNPVSAIGLLAPMLLGQRIPNWFDQAWWGPSHQVEQFAYAGIVPLLLALIAIRSARAEGGRWAFVVLTVFAVLLALGKYGPLCPILYWVPGSSLFRVPARAMVLANLGIAALAAFALHDLCSSHSPQRVRLRAAAQACTRRPIRYALFIMLAVLASVIVALPFLDETTALEAKRAIDPLNPALWIPALMIAAGLAAVGGLSRRWRQRGPLWPIVAVTILDLAIVGWSIDVPAAFTSMDELLNPRERRQWARHVTAESGRLWVVTDTAGVYSDPIAKGVANTNIMLGVQSLSDYGPLQPKLTRDKFRFAAWGVSEISEQLLRDSAWMARFNVEWILLCGPDLPAPRGCGLVTVTDNGFRLYRNPAAFGEAFVELDGAVHPAATEHLSPQSLVTHVSASASRPGSRRLVLSRLAISGWTARAADTELPIEITRDGLMSVRLPEEVTNVAWSYRPPLQTVGVAVSAATVICLALATVLGKREHRRPAGA